MYLIRYLCPHGTDPGCHGFTIDLFSQWKELVASSEMTQEKVNTLIKTDGRRWLDRCGYNAIFDPDNCGFQADKKKPHGPNAHPLYETSQIRVSWGEWGAEHITVPGNACGLDIDQRLFGRLTDGPSLVPHNIDNWSQKQLLLIVFTELAADVVLFSKRKPRP